MKPTFKSPGYERLILKRGVLLSTFGFNFDLRRYIKEGGAAWFMDLSAADPTAGRCRLTLSNAR